MPYPARHLHEGEDVYLDARSHWSVLFLPSLETVVILGAEGAGFVLWGSAPVWFGWVLLAIGLVAVGHFLARLFSWRSTNLVVTSMRVIGRQGVLHRHGVEIPISSVQSVQYSQSLIARMLKKGDLEVDPAGSHDAEIFADIPRPAAAQSLINRAIDAAHGRNLAQAAPVAKESVADEIERLADLHSRGIITDEEFDHIKGEVIARGRAPQ
ncbi:MAG: PH domain-containing protein [Acidimicrobiales bacterium]